MSKDEALKLALEALYDIIPANANREEINRIQQKAITAIKEALAQPEQEPVAYPEGDVVGPCVCGSWPGGKCFKCPRITTPPQRPWVGLTDEEMEATFIECGGKWNGDYWRIEDADFHPFLRTIEAKLKEKNT